VLGDRAAYPTDGLDPQEAALREGGRPGTPGWGEVDPDRYGRLGADGELRAVPTEAGRYQDFYAQLAAALRGGAPLPVDPADSVGVVELIELAHQSAAQGVTLPVPPRP
jgi:predicted dehydrogenase